MKKKTFVKAVIIFIILEVVVMINLPRIPLVKCDKDVKKKCGFEVDDSAYNLWYNAFGMPIFVHPKKAREHFAVDYKEALEFIEEKGAKRPFDYNYDTLKYYENLHGQINFNDKTLPSEYRWVEKKAQSILSYAEVWLDSKWKYVADVPIVPDVIIFLMIVILINCVAVFIFGNIYKESVDE